MKSITQVVENLIKPYIDSHDRAAEAIIAPVETDATSASDDYVVGKQLILDNVLYDVIAPITTGDALVVNTNIKASDNVSSDIEALTKGLEDEAATRSVLGAKNILPFDLADIKALNTNGTWAGNVYSYRGVDFTVNADGTVTANGTATGGNASIKLYNASANYEMLGKKVILNGCPSGGSATTYRIQAYRMGSADGSTGTYFDDGEGTISFDALNNASGTVGSFAVAVYENATVTNLLFKPMVRLSSDPDDTYQPYAKTNQELTAENQTLTNQANAMVNVYGSKNLFQYDYPSTTINGVTITINSDKTISLSGTASADTWIILNAKVHLDTTREYILTGCPSGGSASSYNLAASDSSSWWQLDTGEGVSFTPTGADNTQIYIQFPNGTDMTGKVFKPMIRDARIADATYEPYSMTNQEITPYVQAISNPNLLDNPWFTVNQRGQNSYTANGTYTVDRWKITNTNDLGSVVVGDGLTIDNTNGSANLNFTQTNRYDEAPFKNLLGKTVTLSVLLSDGSIISDSGVIPSSPSSWTAIISKDISSKGSFALQANDNRVLVTIGLYSSKSITIKAVKLELGSVSTLAQDTAPNYQQELAKCQRYYYRTKPNETWASGVFTSATNFQIFVNLPVPMRTPTSIAMNGTLYCCDEDHGGASGFQTSSINTSSYTTPIGGFMLVYATVSGATKGNIGWAQFRDANSYFEINADL